MDTAVKCSLDWGFFSKRTNKKHPGLCKGSGFRSSFLWYSTSGARLQLKHLKRCLPSPVVTAYMGTFRMVCPGFLLLDSAKLPFCPLPALILR